MDISIIIPTFNRKSALKKCLNALQRQSIDKNWEVIIVDDGGSVELSELMKRIDQNLDIKLVRQDNKGPAAARNYGVRLAKGEYIAFLDDDCEPQEGWLQNLMINANEGVMTGGKTTNKLHDNPYSETSQLLVSFLYEYFEGKMWYFFTSNNLLVDKKSFLEIGGFDETFETAAGEDRELCARWSLSNYKLQYESRAVIWHSHLLNFISFWRQHYKYGKAAILYREKIRKSGMNNTPLEIRFYFRLLGFPFSRDYRFVQKLKLSILLFLSQIATLFGAIMSVRK